MRPREDFYTHCPQCETRLRITLAAKLQAGRAGSLCQCRKCNHEWVCIQEWMYRDLPTLQAAPRVAMPVLQQPAFQPQISTPAPVETSVVPRPHLFGQPQAQPVASNSQVATSTHSAVPQPHVQAWSWERQTAQRPQSTPNH